MTRIHLGLPASNQVLKLKKSAVFQKEICRRLTLLQGGFERSLPLFAASPWLGVRISTQLRLESVPATLFDV